MRVELASEGEYRFWLKFYKLWRENILAKSFALIFSCSGVLGQQNFCRLVTFGEDKRVLAKSWSPILLFAVVCIRFFMIRSE